MNKGIRINMTVTALWVLGFCCGIWLNPSTVCAQATPPAWTQTGGVGTYPSELYITGVGSAKVRYGDTAAAQAEADSKAISQVAKQIKVKIKQFDDSVVSETGTTGSKTATGQYSVWQRTAAYVNLKVEGARIKDRYYDQQRQQLYSLALLDRTAQGRLLSEEIRSLEMGVETLLHEAEKHVGNNQKVHRSLIAYGLALQKQLMALRKNQYLNIIAPKLAHRGLPQNLANLQTDLTRLLSRFTVEMLQGDKQTGSIGGNLENALIIRVRHDGQPAPAIPIAFSFVDGRGHIDRNARTDQNGLATSTVSNLGPTGKKINKIRAYVNCYPSHSNMQRELLSVIPPVALQYTYFLPAVEDIRIAVIVRDYNMGALQPESYLANQVKRYLSQARLNVLKEIPDQYQLTAVDLNSESQMNQKLARLSDIADIVIIGEARSTLAGDQYNPQLVFSRARAVVKIVDLKSNVEMGSIDLSTKGAGPSRKESGRRTLQKVSTSAANAVVKEVNRSLLGK